MHTTTLHFICPGAKAKGVFHQHVFDTNFRIQRPSVLIRECKRIYIRQRSFFLRNQGLTIKELLPCKKSWG